MPHTYTLEVNLAPRYFQEKGKIALFFSVQEEPPLGVQIFLLVMTNMNLSVEFLRWKILCATQSRFKAKSAIAMCNCSLAFSGSGVRASACGYLAGALITTDPKYSIGGDRVLSYIM